MPVSSTSAEASAPSVSPGALMIYTGDKFPQWKGDALLGALSGEAFIRVDIDGDNARKADQWAMGARIRAVDQGPDGNVYLLEDGPSGGRLSAATSVSHACDVSRSRLSAATVESRSRHGWSVHGVRGIRA